MKAPVETLGGGTGAEMMHLNGITGDLFSEAVHAVQIPTLPDPASRRAAVLEAFRRGERLTHADALRRGWGWRLAADVFALSHEHGWPIVAAMIPNPGGNPIAEYWLPADARQRGG